MDSLVGVRTEQLEMKLQLNSYQLLMRKFHKIFFFLIYLNIKQRRRFDINRHCSLSIT